MADVSIQFHALATEELLPFAKQFVDDYGLYIVAIRYHPYEAVQIDSGMLGEVFAERSYRRLAFTLTKPSLPAESANKLADQNPDKLVLDIGRLDEQGLMESWLAARTDNAEAIRIWREIAKRLKSMTKAGVVVMNPKTGASSKRRDYRFTEGAKNLASKGISILTTNRLLLKLGGI